MKRIIIVVILVSIAAIAGIVRSHSRGSVTLSELPHVISGDQESTGEVREEIRKSYDLSPSARVEVSGINGSVNIETADTTTAEVYIERIGKSHEMLSRRKVTIDAAAGNLTIHGGNGDVGFFARIFASKPSERVTLRLPRQISLVAKGVNGSVVAGEIDGSVEVHGVNGKVDIAQASSAEFKGINGNVSVALKQLDRDGVDISGINGNIELRLSKGLNADLDAHGMNGSVMSDLQDVVVEKTNHGSYSAHIGNGGNSISATGINGNIRLTRPMTASTTTDQPKSKS